MKPAPVVLRRLLTALLVVLTPLAGLDLCTAGALAGRADLMCGMERSARPCATPPACPHCTPVPRVPTPPSPASHGPTCCDLQPQASSVGEVPALLTPAVTAHPAVAVADLVGDPPALPAVRVEPPDGRAPPGEFPPPLSPRAPPLG